MKMLASTAMHILYMAASQGTLQERSQAVQAYLEQIVRETLNHASHTRGMTDVERAACFVFPTPPVPTPHTP